MSKKNKKFYKNVFISDIHLGTKATKSDLLSDFLSSFECETLWLVGDILDGWQMSKNSAYFPQQHVNIVRKILSKAKKGTIVKYVIGNHDDFLRKYQDLVHSFGNIQIENEFLFTSVSGKKYLVTHGDLYDGIVLHHKWLAYFGDTLYNLAVDLNTIVNKVRSYYGFNYWSLANFLKSKVKTALEFIFAFQTSVTREAKRRELDGVITGHIHVPHFEIIDGIEYWNDGDWTESCSAIVEHEDGKMEIIYVKELQNEDN
jgi:UDP-2,3-diacylglucosamine pyrophosphatase LpxH